MPARGAALAPFSLSAFAEFAVVFVGLHEDSSCCVLFTVSKYDKCHMNYREIFGYMGNQLLGLVVFCLTALLGPWKSKMLKHRPLHCTARLQIVSGCFRGISPNTQLSTIIEGGSVSHRLLKAFSCKRSGFSTIKKSKAFYCCGVGHAGCN